MKTKTTFIVFLLVFFYGAFSFGQINSKTIANIKDGKPLIQLTGIEEVDLALKKALDNYWTFNEEIEIAEPDNSDNKRPDIQFATSYLTLGDGLWADTIGEAIFFHVNVRNKSLKVGLNKYSELKYFDLVELIKRAQFIMSEVIDEGSWGKVYVATKKKYAKELKDKVLLVDRRLLKDDLDEKSFKKIYPYEFKIVAPEKVKKAILENDASVAYIVVVEQKVGMNVQYICNAGTGKIYTRKHTTFQTVGSLSKKKYDSFVSKSDLKKLSRNVK